MKNQDKMAEDGGWKCTASGGESSWLVLDGAIIEVRAVKVDGEVLANDE